MFGSTLANTPRSTPRLVLRPFRRRDVAAMHEAIVPSLPELSRWLPWAVGYTRAVAQQYVRDSIAAWSDAKAWDFAIRSITDPERHLGNVSLWYTSRQNDVGEIGYWVRSDETGKGICTEAVARILDVAFDELDMHRVTLRIAVGNRGSERVAEKLGFLLEGTLREEVRVGTEWLDHTVWSLLRPEWQVQRAVYRAREWI